MQQPTLEILAHQRDLVAIARQATNDVNEAGLLVHRVLSEAFVKYRHDKLDLTEALRSDMRAILRRAAGAAARM
jgi:hypothetical protein